MSDDFAILQIRTLATGSLADGGRVGLAEIKTTNLVELHDPIRVDEEIDTSEVGERRIEVTVSEKALERMASTDHVASSGFKPWERRGSQEARSPNDSR